MKPVYIDELRESNIEKLPQFYLVSKNDEGVFFLVICRSRRQTNVVLVDRGVELNIHICM